MLEGAEVLLVVAVVVAAVAVVVAAVAVVVVAKRVQSLRTTKITKTSSKKEDQMVILCIKVNSPKNIPNCPMVKRRAIIWKKVAEGQTKKQLMQRTTFP